jgi:hypothetical protein
MSSSNSSKKGWDWTGESLKRRKDLDDDKDYNFYITMPGKTDATHVTMKGYDTFANKIQELNPVINPRNVKFVVSGDHTKRRSVNLMAMDMDSKYLTVKPPSLWGSVKRTLTSKNRRGGKSKRRRGGRSRRRR